MKRFLFLLMAMFAALTFAACGGGDNDHHDDDEHHNEDHDYDDEHGHGHGGEAHALGHQDIHGGHKLAVAHIGEFEPGEEVMLEIRLTKESESVAGAIILAHISGEDGKKLTAPAEASYADGDDPFYDCHIMLPDEMPEHAEVVVECEVAGENSTGRFEIEHHEE